MEVSIPCRIFSICEDVDRDRHWLFLDFNLSENPSEWVRQEACFSISPKDLYSLRHLYNERLEMVISDDVDVRKPEDPGNIPVRVWKTESLLDRDEGGEATLLVNYEGEVSQNNKISFQVPTLYILLFFSKRLTRTLVMYFRLQPPPDSRRR